MAFEILGALCTILPSRMYITVRYCETLDILWTLSSLHAHQDLASGRVVCKASRYTGHELILNIDGGGEDLGLCLHFQRQSIS
jgi:hypothetical protein